MNFNAVRDLVLSFDDGPTGNAFLDGRYQWQIDTFGHAKPYYRLFYRLSELLKPRMVLELGAWRGTGAAHWAPHAGTVVTIDHHTDPGDDENKRWCLEAQQRFANLFYLQGWTWDVRDDVWNLGKYIDVLFIDSWHHYDKAMKDWDTYRDMLRPEGALVICDDIYNVEPTLHNMVEFWIDVSRGYESFLVEGMNTSPNSINTYPMGFMLYES